MTIKDSGTMREFASGFHRDSAAGKPRYSLIPRGPLRRVADHYTAGAAAHGDDNWRLACTPEELLEFKESAFRHLVEWLSGDDAEDHGAAVVWNVMCGMDLEQRLAESSENIGALRRAIVLDDRVPPGVIVAFEPEGARSTEDLARDATLDDMDAAARHAHRHSFSYQDGATAHRMPSGVVLWTCACGEATYNERAGF